MPASALPVASVSPTVGLTGVSPRTDISPSASAAVPCMSILPPLSMTQYCPSCPMAAMASLSVTVMITRFGR